MLIGGLDKLINYGKIIQYTVVKTNDLNLNVLTQLKVK